MTVYGLDVSDFQRGLPMSVVKANGFDFVIARALSFPGGAMVVDPSYGAFRDGCRAEGLLFGAYVLFHPSWTPQAQAALLAQAIGDKTIPVMIDWEPDGAAPTIGYAEACFDACAALGLRVSVLYGPHWFENQQGTPSLTGRPWALVNSSYGSNPAGFASSVYPGDQSPGWTGYGGLPVTVLQFGSQILLTGFAGRVDADAYRGTLAQLKATRLFKDFAAPPPPPPPAPNRKDVGMLIIEPDPSGVPAGTTWPGVFLWNGTPGAANLTHVSDPTQLAAFEAAGLPRVAAVSWPQWELITMGEAVAE